MTETTLEKPDFSNYTWFSGTKAEYNALSISTYEGKMYLGIKGFDKKSNSHGYIQAEFDPEVLRELRDHLDTVVQG